MVNALVDASVDLLWTQRFCVTNISVKNCFFRPYDGVGKDFQRCRFRVPTYVVKIADANVQPIGVHMQFHFRRHLFDCIS